MKISREVDNAARRFNDARVALLDELENPHRESHRFRLLVAELSKSIEAYLKALRRGSLRDGSKSMTSTKPEMPQSR